MSVGPFVAATLNGLSEEIFDKRISIVGWQVFIPGVRITLWIAALIILGAGFLAFSSVRNFLEDDLLLEEEEST